MAGWVSIRGYGTSIRYIILERQSSVFGLCGDADDGCYAHWALCCSVHGDLEAARRSPQQSPGNRAELVCEGIGIGIGVRVGVQCESDESKNRMGGAWAARAPWS